MAGSWFDRFVITPQQKQALDQQLVKLGVMSPQSYDQAYPANPQAPQTVTATPAPTFLQRAAQAMSDEIQHLSPSAAAARWAARRIPASEDYTGVPNADNSPDAQLARAAERVTRTERQFRQQHAQEQLDNPPSWSDRGADFLGSAAGGLLSNPLNVIAPGESLVGKMLGQAAVAGVGNAAQQGEEIGEGVRDQFSPSEALLNAGSGALGVGVLHGAGRLLDTIRNRGYLTAPETPTPYDPNMGITDASHYLDRANSEGLPFMNSPEAVDYFTKNAPAISAELDARTRGPMSDAARADIERRADVVPQEDVNYATPEQAREIEASHPLEVPVEGGRPITETPAEQPAAAPIPQEFNPEATAAGALDQLEFPNGRVEPIQVLNDEGLRQRFQDFGIEPEQLMARTSREMGQANEPAGNPYTMMTPDNVTPEGPFRTPEAANDAYEMSPFDALRQEYGNDSYRQRLEAAANDGNLNSKAALEEPRPSDSGNGSGGGNDNGGTGGGGGPEEPPSEPIDFDSVQTRLTQALRSARRLLPDQRALYREARSQKMADVGQARAMTSGEAGLHAELGALKGELPKQEFEGVREQFTQPEIDALFDHVKAAENMPSYYDQINARIGLGKLLDGQLPTKSELSVLSRVFDHKFIAAALSNRTLVQKVVDAAGNAINVPRSLMSSFDLSAPFRQGIFLANRSDFWKAFPDMFKAFGSERAYKGIMDDIYSRPTYDLMQEGGLSLSDPSGHHLSDREEAFMSNWAEKIPVIGNIVRRSDRAYSGFLNKVRADSFDSILYQMQKAGVDFDDPASIKGLANFVNTATGRGDLGKFAQAGPVLNSLFFSPRLIASRVQLLNPAFYATLPPVVRQEAIKSLLSLGTAATTIAGLAHAGGLDVEWDPRSSQFMKIISGNTHYDILGGFGQYITLGARLAMNETKDKSGNIVPLGSKYGQDTRLDTAEKFVEGKASPVAGFVMDYLRGKTYTGDQFAVRDEAAKLFQPLFLQDLTDVVKQEGVAKGSAMAVPGLFGFGMNTYSPVPPAPAQLSMDGQKVDLNYDARKQWQNLVQSWYDVNVKQLKDSGEWDKLSKDERGQLTQQIIKDGKEKAKEQMFAPDQAKAAPASPAAAPSPADQVSDGQPLFEGFSGLPTSIRRTAAGNASVGGKRDSQHLGGDAVDFVPPPGMSMRQLEDEARKYFPGNYVLNEGTHVHVRIPGFNGPLFGKNGTK